MSQKFGLQVWLIYPPADASTFIPDISTIHTISMVDISFMAHSWLIYPPFMMDISAIHAYPWLIYPLLANTSTSIIDTSALMVHIFAFMWIYCLITTGQTFGKWVTYTASAQHAKDSGYWCQQLLRCTSHTATHLHLSSCCLLYVRPSSHPVLQ
jgi:hypothetical protein